MIVLVAEKQSLLLAQEHMRESSEVHLIRGNILNIQLVLKLVIESLLHFEHFVFLAKT